MLGLSNGLTYGGFIKTPYFTYTSDFTNLDDIWGSDGVYEVPATRWIYYSLQGGTTTQRFSFAANQNIPGGSGGGWLKVTYPNTNQTNVSGIQKSILEYGDPLGLRKTGDWTRMRYKIYLYDDGNNFWEGTGNISNTRIYPTGPPFNTSSIPRDEIVEVDVTSGEDSNDAGTDIRIDFGCTLCNNPQANAVFYIKDVVVELFRQEDA